MGIFFEKRYIYIVGPNARILYCTYIIVLPIKWLMVDEDRCRINLSAHAAWMLTQQEETQRSQHRCPTYVPNKMEIG